MRHIGGCAALPLRNLSTGPQQHLHRHQPPRGPAPTARPAGGGFAPGQDASGSEPRPRILQQPQPCPHPRRLSERPARARAGALRRATVAPSGSDGPLGGPGGGRAGEGEVEGPVPHAPHSRDRDLPDASVSSSRTEGVCVCVCVCVCRGREREQESERERERESEREKLVSRGLPNARGWGGRAGAEPAPAGVHNSHGRASSPR